MMGGPGMGGSPMMGGPMMAGPPGMGGPGMMMPGGMPGGGMPGGPPKPKKKKKKGKVKPKGKMKPLHWTKFNLKKSKGTIFETMDEEECREQIFGEIGEEDFVKLFGIPKKKKK